MATITINIDSKVKTFLEDEGIDVTQMAQNLLDNYSTQIVNQRYQTSLTLDKKIDEISKQKVK